MAVETFDLGFDCRECDEILQKERGCYEDGSTPYYFGDMSFRRCPLKVVTRESWELLTAFGLYKKGLLPHGKSWLEESSKFIDAMLFIESEIAKYEKKQLDKLKRKKYGRR